MLCAGMCGGWVASDTHGRVVQRPLNHPGKRGGVWRELGQTKLAGGDAAHGFAILDVSHHNGAGRDNRSTADCDSLANDCPRSDVRATSDLNATAKPSAGCNMDMVAHETIVLDNRTSVDQHVVANLRARADYCSGHHLNAG